MTTKLDTLKAIIENAGIEVDPNDFDFTQPDSMDESGSEGAWDCAGIVAQEILAKICGKDWFDISDNRYYDARDSLQSLLYNLMCDFKDEVDEDDDGDDDPDNDTREYLNQQ